MTDAARLGDALTGRYVIERELGAGGMATVYLALDVRHERRVAIKVLRPDLAAVLGAERFLREIQIAAQLNHPHILGLIDSGSFPDAAGGASECPYYVMPYVEGESLRDRLGRELQLPLEDALTIAREVADALGYAHSRGIVHRDIKPENILLSGGHAVVADFGIARAVGTAGGTRLTETGMSIGTPSYMSPEQSLGQEVDGRTDIYALACVLYETLVGEPPYTGPTAQAIIARRLSEPVPSLRVVRDGVPPVVEVAIKKALARTPADRFATAMKFTEALTATVVDVTPRGRLLTRGRVAGAAVAVALIATGGWLALRGPAVSPSASVIAVLPLSTALGDTDLSRLGQTLTFTISSGLDGAGGIRTVDPRSVLARIDDVRGTNWLPNAKARGKTLGAGSVVLGSLARVGSNVQLDLRLVSTDTSSEPLARASVTNAPDSIAALTDSATWSLLRQIWRHGATPSPSLAAVTTHSVPALNAFLDGERLSVAGRWSDAVEAFAAAFKADSTFWLAAWRYNEGQQWVGGEPDWDTALTRKYEAHVSSFGERDRGLIEGEMTSATEVYQTHLARFRALSERFPADWAAIWPYADHLVHGGPLIGYSGADARAALEQTVELNPRLQNAWVHLFTMSMGADSSQSGRALRALTELGGLEIFPGGSGRDPTLGARLCQAAYGQPPEPLFDSVAAVISGASTPGPHVFGTVFLTNFGFPAAQLQLNQLLLQRDRAGRFAPQLWRSSASAWAIRGAWDSAMIAMDKYAAAAQEQAEGVEIFRFAVAGAWLGGLPIERAEARRAAAVRFLGQLQGEPAARDRARLAWSDGMLAVLRSDARALAAARAALEHSGDANIGFLDRSLAAFESQLRGRKRQAADSLWVLDGAATENELLSFHDGYARSIDHLAAAQWLLQLGDTSRAERLLTWHEQDSPAGGTWLFAPLAYLQLARIADAKGRTAEARASYHQFLMRFSLPVPVLRPLAAEAQAALHRLS